MNSSLRGLDAFLKRANEKLQNNILIALSKLGEECVTKVRARPQGESWIDHTSNLRSSIGYAVYKEGEKFMQSTFEVLGDGGKGSIEGRRMVDQLASEYSKAYALVIVAAMEYAENVEAIESKDVLESTRIWAEEVVEEKLKIAIDSAIKEINSWMI